MSFKPPVTSQVRSKSKCLIYLYLLNGIGARNNDVKRKHVQWTGVDGVADICMHHSENLVTIFQVKVIRGLKVKTQSTKFRYSGAKIHVFRSDFHKEHENDLHFWTVFSVSVCWRACASVQCRRRTGRRQRTWVVSIPALASLRLRGGPLLVLDGRGRPLRSVLIGIVSGTAPLTPPPDDAATVSGETNKQHTQLVGTRNTTH